MEIILVPDGVPEFLLVKDFLSDNNVPGHITVLKSTPTPRGPAHARNRGAASASSELLLFIDSDVVVPKDIIERVEKVFSESSKTDALIGSYDDQPGKTNFLSQYRNLLHHYVHQTSSVDASTFWGACGAIRKGVFMSAGGFSESYTKPSVEDIEFGYRITRKGLKIRLCKSIQVKHLKYWDARSIIKTDLLQRAIPWSELILKNSAFQNDLNLRYSHRLSVGILFLMIFLLGVSFWSPLGVLPALFLAFMLFLINLPMYSFFFRKRGVIFVLGAILWHWIYYAYSGLGFVIGFIRHRFLRN